MIETEILDVNVGLPFGRHKNQPLSEVPESYLRWCIETCKLSSGLRSAVAAELTSRGIEVPPAPPPRWLWFMR
jgi:hypothetical protein